MKMVCLSCGAEQVYDPARRHAPTVSPDYVTAYCPAENKHRIHKLGGKAPALVEPPKRRRRK